GERACDWRNSWPLLPLTSGNGGKSDCFLGTRRPLNAVSHPSQTATFPNRRPAGLKKWPRPAAAATGRAGSTLLELDRGAGSLELLLELFGFRLGDGFLDRLRRAFDQILRFLEAQASDGADFLDDVDLVCADVLQDDGELVLLLGGGRSGSAGGSGDGDRRSG